MLRPSSETVRAAIVLAALASAFLTAPVHAKPRGKGKASPVVRVCTSVDVYEGAIDAVHPMHRVSEVCADVAPNVARAAIEACSAEGDPAACEVLMTPDRRTILIERKILIPADDLAIVESAVQS